MNYNYPKGKDARNKAFVILVALIFLGSMGGALLYSTGSSNTNVELPPSKNVQALSDAQKQRILFGSEENPADRYVLLTLLIPKVCDLDCSRTKMIFGQIITAFDPAVYVFEQQSDSQSLDVSILMESYLDKKELSQFNQTAVEDFICENTAYLYRLDECVIRKMDLGASDGNETGRSGANGTAIQQNTSAGGAENTAQ